MKRVLSTLFFLFLIVSTIDVFAVNDIITVIQDDGAGGGGQSFIQIIKQKFIEGGAGFMGIVLICLILGLAIAIERIIYLNFADTNTKKLVDNVENALSSKGIEDAKELARNTRGPVASIFYQGLDRLGDGQSIDEVEKAVVSYGGVQMGQLEKTYHGYLYLLPWPPCLVLWVR